MKKLITIVILLFSNDTIAKERLITINNDSLEVNYNNVYKEIRKHNIEFSDIVFCQAILESGHFKSKIAKNNNNLFGMRHPNKRKTESRGSRYKYAIFDNWQDSVKDYKLWQTNFLKNRYISRSAYMNYIENTYCGYSNYILNLNKIHKKYYYLFN
jgi:uncharacterized FlgJ-related protein